MNFIKIFFVLALICSAQCFAYELVCEGSVQQNSDQSVVEVGCTEVKSISGSLRYSLERIEDEVGDKSLIDMCNQAYKKMLGMDLPSLFKPGVIESLFAQCNKGTKKLK